MKRIHSLLVVLLLFAYAGTATAVMPAVVAALAELDGSHRVMICRTEQGLQVRLHHREDDYTPEVCDHAGLLAKVVVSFCHPAEEGDHSLSSNQVAGTLAGPDEEAKKFTKDKQCSSLERADYDTRQTRVSLEVSDRHTLRGWHLSRAMALREMATIRLLI